MKHLIHIVSALSLLAACSSATEEQPAQSAGGSLGVAGVGGAAAGTGGQVGGSAGVAGGGGGAAGASGGAAGAAVAGSAGTAGASGAGGAGGQGGAGGAAGGAAGSGGGGTGGGGGATQMSPEEALYTQMCSACHGATAEGTLLGPEIRHPVPDFTTYMVRNGSMTRNPNTTYPGPMVPLDMGFVSDAELAMIITYLDSFPQPTTGEALYLDYCANCHGADGKGGQTTRDLTALADPLATAVPTNVRSGHHLENEYHLLTEYMPAQDATVLTDAELMLIATHIETL